MQFCTQNVLLAKTYDPKEDDPTDYWMTEKVDGIRAIWDGQEFYTRHGNLIKAPAFFKKAIPKVVLDGELWCGRGNFDKTLSVVMSKKEEKFRNWKTVKFLIFDAPFYGKRYEARIEYLKTLITEKCKFCYTLNVVRCTGKRHLDECMQEVLNEGGEGIMLREPYSFYVGKRSETLLKCKWFASEEAIIRGYKKNYDNLVYELICEMKNTVIISLSSGLTNALQRNPPSIGSIVEFKFQEFFKSGQPRFAVFLRVRRDLEWKDVKFKAYTNLLYKRLSNDNNQIILSKSLILFEAPPRRNRDGSPVNSQFNNDDIEEDSQISSGEEEPEFITVSDHENTIEVQKEVLNSSDIIPEVDIFVPPVLVISPVVIPIALPVKVNLLICEYGLLCSRKAPEHAQLYKHL